MLKRPRKIGDSAMLCEACEHGDHEQCGMQTWCECDCEGPDEAYTPHGYGFRDDLDGGRLFKLSEAEMAAREHADLNWDRKKQPVMWHVTYADFLAGAKWARNSGD